jgi:2,3-dihydroxybenzoate decarboxylase
MQATRRAVLTASAALATSAATSAVAAESPSVTRSKIALEEHFITPGLLPYFKSGKPSLAPEVLATVVRRLSDFGEERLAQMDAAGVEKSVLSITGPGVQVEPNTAKAQRLATEANDVLAREIAHRPDRYGGFAHLAMQDPAWGADELERCVRQLGFQGALINGPTNGVYLDDPSNDVFWERLEALDVPLYLHPADSYRLPYVLEGAPALTRATWEWTTDTSTQALRLIVSGVFDRYPRLRVILGHAGETLPYMLWRLDSRYAFYLQQHPIKRPPSAYIQDNFWVTMSGQFSAVPLQAAIAALGVERVLFSIDYPYEVSAVAGKFMDSTPLTEDARARIAYGNAATLLRIGV